MISRKILIPLALSLCTGCAHKFVEKVAVTPMDESADVVDRAPRSGMYRVRFVDNDRYLKTPLLAEDRWMKKGDPIGFRTMDDGKLAAVVGDDQFPLENAPESATHVMWFHKSKQPTQLTKSTAKLLAAAGDIAGEFIIGGLQAYARADEDGDAISLIADCLLSDSGSDESDRHHRDRGHHESGHRESNHHETGHNKSVHPESDTHPSRHAS